MAIISEGKFRSRDDGLLVDGLGRPFNAHVDRGVSCASLNDRSRGCGNRRDEQGDGG